MAEKGKDNVRVLPERRPDEVLAGLERLKRNLPAIMECMPILAKARRAAYEAYREEGFTEEQALILCQKVY
jgi:hypothetical protein